MGVGVVLAREGFEAALVVALVLAFLHRTGRGSEARAVWAGAGAAVGLSAAVAAVLFLVGAENSRDGPRRRSRASRRWRPPRC